MNDLLLSAYVLVWPVIAAAILVMLVFAVVRDVRAAKEDGREMI